MSGFFSGSFDPFWPHAILLTAAIAASFAVAAGIVIENPKWSLANALVVGGVAIEATCTLLLFGFDEAISTAQQSKIITLEQHLAPRYIPEDRKPELIAKLSPFAGTEFDARTNMHDNEQVRLLASIMEVLAAAGWKQIDWQYSAGGMTYKLGPGAGSANIGEAATYDVEL